MKVTPGHRADRGEPVIVALVGPTASGKSSLAIDLAEALDGEIVNADSVLLYRGMDIGSAKPSADELRSVPHHLVDVWDITHEATVAEFQELARAAIDDIVARKKVAIVVGGSSLYVRAIIDPLEFPGTDPQVRARWQAELEAVGSENLHGVLAARDPDAAEQILPSNGRRIVRALEVIELTGKPFAARLPDFVSVYPQLVMVGIDMDRDQLDERISARVEQMWDDGLVDEVISLEGLAQTPTASRAIGYQQVLAQLAGELSEEEAKADTITGTRKLARRQDRMMRKDPRIEWFPSGPDLFNDVLTFVNNAANRVG